MELDFTGADFVTAIASVPAIVAIIGVLKSAGMPAKASPAIAIMLGVGLQLAVLYWGATPWFAAIAQGVVFGLGACGAYDLTRMLAPEMGDPPRRAIDEG